MSNSDSVGGDTAESSPRGGDDSTLLSISGVLTDLTGVAGDTIRFGGFELAGVGTIRPALMRVEMACKRCATRFDVSISQVSYLASQLARS